MARSSLRGASRRLTNAHRRSRAEARATSRDDDKRILGVNFPATPLAFPGPSPFPARRDPCPACRPPSRACTPGASTRRPTARRPTAASLRPGSPCRPASRRRPPASLLGGARYGDRLADVCAQRVLVAPVPRRTRRQLPGRGTVRDREARPALGVCRPGDRPGHGHRDLGRLVRFRRFRAFWRVPAFRRLCRVRSVLGTRCLCGFLGISRSRGVLGEASAGAGDGSAGAGDFGRRRVGGTRARRRGDPI